ncbi:UNVERIFIED_CONTAM: putative protein C16G5.07c [Sesamum angustifolium]|uniref:Band 7 domain-containing protein n=1 Tax=Sesamum angustifolium TaxID=2727405 RepID=A0AAW2PSL2_9LAMI
MNFVKSNPLDKLRKARSLVAARSAISSRAISTAPPPLLNQSPAHVAPRQLLYPFSAAVRHIRYPRDPSSSLHKTTMRSELGKITLDKTFEERDTLNENIVISINEAAKDWGLQCLRYEIRDISPPRGVRAAMEMQAEAERKRRAQVLESEGERQANINIADGKKNAVILASEAAKLDQVNRAQGEAEAILARAQATAEGIALVSQSLKENGGVEAASLRVAEQYIHAFSKIAKEGTTVLLPSSASNPANMMAQALAIYKNLIGKDSGYRVPELPQAGSEDHVKIDDSSPEFGEESSQTAEPADRDHFRLGEPVFSLQSPKKDEH